MKILALRVAHVGRFAEPVALENLSGGLDLLSAPNEAGKSTLFRALRAALEIPYKSTDVRKTWLTGLQPYAGGAPTIEIDFEAAKTRWRLTKTFFERQRAELTDLAGGSAWRGADVQDRLDELTRGPEGFERFGVLWVRQGESVDDYRREEWQTLVEREVADAVTEDDARRILRRIKSRIALWQSAHAKPQPSGDYKAAVLAQKSADAVLAAAEQRLADAETAHVRLAALRRERATRTGPAELQRLSDAAAAAKRADDEASRALEKLLEARQTARAAEAEFKAAAATRHEFEATLAEHDRIAADLARLRADLAAVAKDCTDAEAAVQGAEAALASAKAALVAAESAAARHRAAQDLARLRAAEHEARALAAALVALDREHAGAPPITAGDVDALRRTVARADTVRARLGAQAATLTLDLTAEGIERSRLNGRTPESSATITLTGPAVLDIAGIGRITVTPGATADLADLGRQSAEADAAVATHLAALSVEDLAAAEGRFAVAMERAAMRRETAFKLAQLAPAGLDALASEIARLAAQLPEVPSAPELCDPASARTVYDAAMRRHEEATTRLASLALRRATGEATIAAHEPRLAALAEALGPAEERERRRSESRAAEAAASSARAAAERDVSLWRDAAPDERRRAALRQDLAGAVAEIDRFHATDRRLDREIYALQQVIEHDGQSDVEGEVTLARQLRDEAAARRADIEAELAALRLLESRLETALASDEQRRAAPVLDRVAPYLSRIFPDVRLGIDRGFVPVTLERNGRSEPLAALSHGTREQVAIVARLALGRLMADRGAPAPVVLDDALVHSDDRRIEALFDVLKSAAAHHQVIVLTCRERTFDRLDAHRLTLMPWAHRD